MILRCAAYARYSSDLQSPLSIDDQLRICREYAKSRGFVFLEEHIYVDEAVSGVGADRPGLGRLLNTALAAARPFDVILLDDSSRLARNTKDALTFFEKLNFAGIWLIAVSQGIDSDNEQAHVINRFPVPEIFCFASATSILLEALWTHLASHWEASTTSVLPSIVTRVMAAAPCPPGIQSTRGRT